MASMSLYNLWTYTQWDISHSSQGEERQMENEVGSLLDALVGGLLRRREGLEIVVEEVVKVFGEDDT